MILPRLIVSPTNAGIVHDTHQTAADVRTPAVNGNCKPIRRRNIAHIHERMDPPQTSVTQTLDSQCYQCAKGR